MAEQIGNYSRKQKLVLFAIVMIIANDNVFSLRNRTIYEPVLSHEWKVAKFTIVRVHDISGTNQLLTKGNMNKP